MLTLTETFDSTRTAAHSIAEHVLAPARYAIDGKIRLRPLPHGFCVPAVGAASRSISIVGDQIVVTDATGEASATIRTLRQLADLVDVELGTPTAFTPTQPLQPDAALVVDPISMAVIGEWFEFADAALRALAASIGADVEPVLWPEHFDLGISHGGVNFGASLGDGAVPEPYLYVGPHDMTGLSGGFWNVGFGSAITHAEIASVDEALSYFTQGWTLIHP